MSDGLSDTTRPIVLSEPLKTTPTEGFMYDPRPLHVRVAEALGWTQIGPGNSMNMGDPGIGYPPTMPIVGHKEPLPRYDTDWSATGPLMERFRPHMVPFGKGYWEASVYVDGRYEAGQGETVLLAVCNLILALKEAGKL